MAIKNLTPQLAERGKIKIGERGEVKTSQGGKQFAAPKKLDHFIITTTQRDAAGRLLVDTALMSRLVNGHEKLTEIPVRLLYDDPDLNFFTRYACYRGARCWCSGDGETAQRAVGHNGQYQEVPCPCERLDQLYGGQDKCKVMGTLQVLIKGSDRIGGVWKLRITSWNTVNGLLSSMALIKTFTGGPLAGIPLWLVLSPKTVTVPGSGQTQVIYVVSLEYRSRGRKRLEVADGRNIEITMSVEEELAEIGYEIAKRRVANQIRMEQIEAEARKMLAAPHAEPIEEQAETAAEFYPDGFLADAPDSVGEVQMVPDEEAPAEASPSEALAEPSTPPKPKKQASALLF